MWTFCGHLLLAISSVKTTHAFYFYVLLLTDRESILVYVYMCVWIYVYILKIYGFKTF